MTKLILCQILPSIIQNNYKVKDYLPHNHFLFISSFKEPFPMSKITAYSIMLTFLLKNIY